MSKTINYRPILMDELISNQRLNSYASIFLHSNDIELMGAYLWNINACASLYPLLTAAEVTLRNAIDTALSRELGLFWWKGSKLHYNSFAAGAQPPHPVAALKENFSNAAKQVKKDKKKRYSTHNPIPTHHEIIAKTEFSTWEFILDDEFMGPGKIWPKSLGRVFKGVWPTTKASVFLSSTKDLVKTVREFRNRVSHHEPVWKRYGVHTEEQAIAHLQEKLMKIMQLISLLSPEKEKLIIKNDFFSRAERACTIDELRRCQHNFKTNKVKSMTKLCQLVGQAKASNTTKHVTVYNNGKNSFILQPI